MGKLSVLVELQAQFYQNFFVKPGAINETKIGIKISIIMTKNNKPKNSKLKISLANLFDFDFPLANSEV